MRRNPCIRLLGFLLFFAAPAGLAGFELLFSGPLEGDSAPHLIPVQDPLGHPYVGILSTRQARVHDARGKIERVTPLPPHRFSALSSDGGRGVLYTDDVDFAGGEALLFLDPFFDLLAKRALDPGPPVVAALVGERGEGLLLRQEKNGFVLVRYPADGANSTRWSIRCPGGATFVPRRGFGRDPRALFFEDSAGAPFLFLPGTREPIFYLPQPPGFCRYPAFTTLPPTLFFSRLQAIRNLCRDFSLTAPFAQATPEALLFLPHSTRQALILDPDLPVASPPRRLVLPPHRIALAIVGGEGEETLLLLKQVTSALLPARSSPLRLARFWKDRFIEELTLPIEDDPGSMPGFEIRENHVLIHSSRAFCLVDRRPGRPRPDFDFAARYPAQAPFMPRAYQQVFPYWLADEATPFLHLAMLEAMLSSFTGWSHRPPPQGGLAALLGRPSLRRWNRLEYALFLHRLLGYLRPYAKGQTFPFPEGLFKSGLVRENFIHPGRLTNAEILEVHENLVKLFFESDSGAPIDPDQARRPLPLF